MGDGGYVPYSSFEEPSKNLCGINCTALKIERSQPKLILLKNNP
jgi:hypothetical protein